MPAARRAVSPAGNPRPPGGPRLRRGSERPRRGARLARPGTAGAACLLFNDGTPAAVRRLLAEQLLEGVGARGLAHVEVAADRRTVRLEHAGLPGTAGKQIGEQRRQPGAVHVRTERARCLPGNEWATTEGGRPVHRRDDLVPHRGEDLLLPGRPGAVVLVRSTAVLAHAREAERLLAVQVVLALVQTDSMAAEAIRADALLERHVDAAERVDQLGEVGEADLDHVVDVEVGTEEPLDGLDRQRAAAERERRVDLPRAVAGDVDVGVARDRQLAPGPDPDVQQQDAVRPRRARRARDGLLGLLRALVGAEHEDVAP